MLAVVALTLAALFTGAALYVAGVEHPARGVLAPADQLAQWRPAYARGTLLQAPLALAAGAAGFAVWFQWRDMILWLVGALLIWSAIAYTFALMWRLNGALKATLADADPQEIQTRLARWGRLHVGRTAIGLAATMVYAGALVQIVQR